MDGEGERLRAVALQVSGGARDDDGPVRHLPMDGAGGDRRTHLHGEGGRILVRRESVGATDEEDPVRRDAADAGERETVR